MPERNEGDPTQPLGDEDYYRRHGAPVPADPEPTPPHDGHTIDAGVPTYVGPVRSADPEPEGAAGWDPHRACGGPCETPTPSEPVGAERISDSSPSSEAQVTRTARDGDGGERGWRPEMEQSHAVVVKAQQMWERTDVRAITPTSDTLEAAVALRLVVPSAEVDALRAQLAEVRGVADWCEGMRDQRDRQGRHAIATMYDEVARHLTSVLGAGAPAEDEGDQ